MNSFTQLKHIVRCTDRDNPESVETRRGAVRVGWCVNSIRADYARSLHWKSSCAAAVAVWKCWSNISFGLDSAILLSTRRRHARRGLLKNRIKPAVPVVAAVRRRQWWGCLNSGQIANKTREKEHFEEANIKKRSYSQL